MSSWSTEEEQEQYVKWFAKWSGLSEEFVRLAIKRHPDYYWEQEFRALAPKTKAEQDWFYRTSSLYIFHLASHTYWSLLDDVVEPVLDFGGGVGNNFFPLIRRGVETHYFDISLACTNFVRWRLNEEGIIGGARYRYKILSPFDYSNSFSYTNCLQDTYNAIVLQDVLEHIVDYESLLDSLTSRLRVGGCLYEETWFDGTGSIGETLHLPEKTPLSVYMATHGMEPVRAHVWRKL